MAHDVSMRALKDVKDAECDIQSLMDGIVDEDFIRKETGKKDLASINHLSLVIDTSRQSVYDLHVILPNLQHLVLDESVVTSVRDLGIGLRFLKSLSLSCCGLYDIDGIGVLTGLQDLCLSDNSISDVTPLAMHENLQNLNLSGNRINDISIADSLSSCLALRSLSMSRNPLCKARNYRLIIASLITGLQMLDGTPVDPDAGKKVNNGMILESAAELRMVEEDMDDEMRLENDILGATASASCDTQSKTSTTATSLSGKGTEGIPDTGSELTHGSSVVLAGNMAAAVRRRRGLEGARAGVKAGVDVDPAEYESTLDILDAALGRSNSRTSSRPGSNKERGARGAEDVPHGASFYKEGDVTASLRGSSTLHASLRLSTEDVGDEEEEDAQGRLHSASSPQVSGRDSWSARRRGDSNDLSFREAAPSPALRGTSARSGGRRGDATVEASMSFDGETSRPRTAASGVGNSGSFRLAGAAGTALAASSPRQRNSSRPQSAASVSGLANSPQLGRSASSQAAPFKVTVDKPAPSGAEDTATPPPLSFPMIKGAAQPSKSSSLVHLDIVKRPTGSYMIAQEEESVNESAPGQVAASLDEDSDTEDIAVTHAARHRLMFSSSTAAATNSATANLKARQQILQRLKSSSSKTSDSSDSSAERATASPPPASRAPRAQPHPSGPQAGQQHSPRLEVGIAQRGSARKGSRATECEIESLENSPQRPLSASKNKVAAGKAKETQSSKAGISLGFNLAGSLAAIDKWVQDMNSEDEAGDTDGGSSSERERGQGRGAFAYSATVMPSSRVPDLETLGGMQGGGLEGLSKDSCGSEFSATSRGSRSKILSRDTILSMCSNSGREASTGAQTQDEDSELDEPDLQLPVQKGRQGAATKWVEPEPVEGTVREVDEPLPTGSSRARNADILNRANGRRARGSSPRADPDSQPVSVSTGQTAPAERRARPRAVPDFPVAQQEGVQGHRPSGAASVASGSFIGDEAAADTVSPPRHTATPTASAAPPATGPAVALPDPDLVALLKQRPKDTLVLRTTASFQEFFSGMGARRMKKLLELAYADVEEEVARREKVDKRLKLLNGFMS